jgi:extracellular elastinolytic metalloproteinase
VSALFPINVPVPWLSGSGNNAIAYNGSQLITVPIETSSDLTFNYAVDLTKDPTAGTNVEAAIVNAFYVVNMFHDVAYLYGFTEATFNFQTNDFNKAGQGFDRILVSVQDPSGTNGVDFAILPEYVRPFRICRLAFLTQNSGQSSKMQLYLYVDFTVRPLRDLWPHRWPINAQPRRDSALQNDIIIHECQHGATNRMTGGGNATCLQTAEASALDEGYADAMAE